MAAPTIVLEGLLRHLGDVRAVDGVSLEVAPAEVYGFLGPNGAGKTTVVRMLITLLAPSGGRSSVAGHDIVAEPHAVRLRIGAALQGAGLVAVLGFMLTWVWMIAHGVQMLRGR